MIYSVNNYAAGTTYIINNIVKSSNQFWYSLKNNNVGNTPAISSQYWDGITNHNGVTRPKFFWKPSYNHPVAIEPTVKVIKFGDGYEQRIPDGINTTLLSIDLTFDLRNSAEAEAISHFLEKRAGSEAFVFTPSPPFNLAKLFVCRNFSCNFMFYDNYNISATFNEVAA